jgi:protein involved in polysaccharide export with SLBB domain
MIRHLALVLLLTTIFAPAAFAQITAGRPVQISILGVPPEEAQRVNGTYPVSASGTINMPYIGEIRAAGMSTAGLASTIQNAYKAAGIYTTPTIQVISEDLGAALRENVITVGGFVRTPGAVKFVPGMTLYQAISNRGGASEFGAMNRVLVHSGGKVREYDCTKAQFQNIELKANDTVEVPQKNWRGR